MLNVGLTEGVCVGVRSTMAVFIRSARIKRINVKHLDTRFAPISFHVNAVGLKMKCPQVFR